MRIQNFQLGVLAARVSILKVFVAFFGLIFLLSKAYAQDNVVRYSIEIHDHEIDHIYESDAEISIRVEAKPVSDQAVEHLSGSEKSQALFYQWKTFSGELGERSPLPIGEKLQLRAPFDGPGYVALQISTANSSSQIMDRQPGEAMQFGFVRLAEPNNTKSVTASQSVFGTVHTALNDQAAPVWSKTLTWHTTSAEWWAYEIEKRRENGFEELPIVSGDLWESDDTAAISEEQLNAITNRFKQFALAVPDLKYWELVLEENLTDRYRQTYYWANLYKKAKVIRTAIDQAGLDIKLMYQIAETEITPVRKFLQSNVVRSFDILALHPYAWPDFPDPESWLPDYLDQVRAEMITVNREMPIWFTEVGAPLRGSHQDQFFGYPESGAVVPGFTDQQSVEYMIKMHLVALAEGVEKVFWYNYRDRGNARDYAEDHFGLIDVRGFPKPVYAAYMHLVDLLEGMGTPKKITGSDPTLAHYQVSDKDRTIDILWSRKPDQIKELNLSDHSILNVDQIRGALGEMIDSSTDPIRIGSLPIYIISKH